MQWDKLEAVIEPFYLKAGNGWRPYPLSAMLRFYCLQQWYSLSDPSMEESLYEIASLRREFFSISPEKTFVCLF